MTPARSRDIIVPMMSLHTHVALTYLREYDNPQPVARYDATPARDREAVETASSVGRLRRRLAQMHLAPAR